MAKPELPAEYGDFLQEMKESILKAQIRAGFAANRELIILYWKIGKRILEQQNAHGWGAQVISKLAIDLKIAFPKITGFSSRNLQYMRRFAEAYPEIEFVQAAPALIPWYQNTTLLDKVKSDQERRWYVQQTLQSGWSRDVLVHQIESELHKRQGRAVTNFKSTLPAEQSELAQQVLKDPYVFDFLELKTKSLERDLEEGLLHKLRDFLLELGNGFAFLGSQYHLEVAGKDYYLDLLFYHIKLRCFIIVDLKITEFEPEYAGKMAFYQTAVDEQLRSEHDGATIGLILCKTKNTVIAEYTLRSNTSPIGVSEYKLGQPMPQDLEDNLPQIAELEKRLAESCLEDEHRELLELMVITPGNDDSKTQSSEEEEEEAIVVLQSASSDLVKEARLWSDARVRDIEKRKTLIELEDGPLVVLHLVPLVTKQIAISQDIVATVRDQRLIGLDGVSGGRHNLEGYMVYKIFQSRIGQRAAGYLQLFRTRQIESVSAFALRTGADGRLLFNPFEKSLIERTAEYLQYAVKTQMFPLMLRLSLTGVHSYGMQFKQKDETSSDVLPRVFNQNVVMLPELVIQHPSKIGNAENILRPAIDMIWNACGWPGSPSYDGAGVWHDLVKERRTGWEF